MNREDFFTREMAIRGVLVAGLIMLFGFAVYGREVFIPNMWPSQFLFSGVTLGVAAAFFHHRQFRNGSAALLVWWLASMGLISHVHDFRNSLLFVVDIVAMSAAVYYFYLIIRRPPLSQWFWQLIASSILVGLAAGSVVAFMALLHPQTVFSNPWKVLHAVYMNMRIGILMGLLFGGGDLLANNVVRFLRSRKAVAG